MMSVEEELEKEDLGAFNSKFEIVKDCFGLSQSQPQLFSGGITGHTNGRRQVDSLPPVTLWVGSIPLGLNQQGLRNSFLPFGELLSVNLIKGKSSHYNYGFVTFRMRSSAVQAIENLHQKAPLFMIVQYKREERADPEGSERDSIAAQFSKKWEKPCPDWGWEPEMDYDEEIAREEKMAREVDKFFSDSSSEDEAWNQVPVMKHSSVSTAPENTLVDAAAVLCARCGSSATLRCSMCRTARYCDGSCQRLDWPRHKGKCIKIEAGKDKNGNDKVNVSEIKVKNSNDKVDVSNIRDAVSNVEVDVSDINNKISKYKVDIIKIIDNSGVQETQSEDVLCRRDTSIDCNNICGTDNVTRKLEKNVTNAVYTDGKVALCKSSNKMEKESNPMYCYEPKANENIKDEVMFKDINENSDNDSEENFVSLHDCTQTKNVNDCTTTVEMYPHQTFQQYHVKKDVEMITDLQPFDIGREGSLVILLEVDLSTEEAIIKKVEDDNFREDQPLLSQLMSGCSPETSLMTRPPIPGQLVAALSLSGVYIRAKVELVNLDTLQAHCKYVDDVGEMMVRHFSSLSVLPESCLCVPLLARTVKLFNNCLVSPLLTFMIGRKFLAREVSSAISSTSLPLVELTKPIQKSFHRAQSTINKQQSKDDGQSSNCSTELSLSFPELRVGQGSPMTVLHVESPREIYLCNNERELAKLHEHIFNIASSINSDPLFVPTNGSLVLARSEGNWYRALVEKVEGISVKIFCPDFGFRDTISLDMVRKVNKRINSIQQRFLACRCILVDWVEQTDFSEREIRNLRKLLPVSASKVKVAVLEKIPLGYVVQIDGVDKRTVSGHKKDTLEEIARLRMEVARLKARGRGSDSD